MKRTPPKEAIEEAANFPNGWVYEIESGYNKDGDIPPSAIKGAWKVDTNGKIEGDFVPNPNYQKKE